MVALAAQPGHLHGGSRRARGGGAEDVVGSMTLFTGRRQLVARLGRLAVEALGVLGLLVGVARPAVDAGEFVGVGQLLTGQIAVAIGALQGSVGGSAQGHGVERWGYAGLTLGGAPPGFVAVYAIP